MGFSAAPMPHKSLLFLKLLEEFPTQCNREYFGRIREQNLDNGNIKVGPGTRH
jgi:hypothetical protein